MKRKITTRKNGHRRCQQFTKQESRTETHHAEQVNINSIMKKYFRTGLIQQRQGARYGDFTTIDSYQDAMNRVLQAEEQFQQLPSEIRTIFGNDPGKLIDFVNDEANHDKAIELGLLPPDRPTEGQDDPIPFGAPQEPEGKSGGKEVPGEPPEPKETAKE